MNILIIGSGVMANNVKNCIDYSKDKLIGMVDYFGNGDFKSFLEVDYKKVDVIIDFSNECMLNDILNFATKYKIPTLIATTGHKEEDIKKINKASKIIPIVLSTNTSIGINLLNSIVSFIKDKIDDFDIEIIEKHHNRKIDAPSGTAKTIYNILNSNKDKIEIFDRSTKREKRNKNEIGIHSIRCGNIYGEHSILISNGDDLLEIKHTALSRNIFAKGALKIADFLVSVKNSPNLYKTEDIL